MDKLTNVTILNKNEVLSLLKITNKTLSRRINKKEIFSIKINGTYLFIKEDILNLEEQEEQEEVFTRKELADFFKVKIEYIYANNDFFDNFTINKKDVQKRYLKSNIIKYVNKERNKYYNTLVKKDIKQKTKNLSTKKIGSLLFASL